MEKSDKMQPIFNQLNEERNTGLIEILIFIAKNKRKIIATSLAFATTGFFTSLIIQNSYRANTKLLPPQQSQSSASAILSQLGGVAGGAGAALGLKNPNDLYIALLKSRSISDKLIQRFDLQKRYNQKYLDQTRIELEQNSFIASGKDGIISIDVEDKDPKMAAAIANAYAEELSNLTGKFALTEASQRRKFYEKQLELIKERIVTAENILAENISISGLTSIDTQSKTVLETTAKLRANISAKEIQLKAIQVFLTPNSPQYKSILQELMGMREELSKLESGIGKEMPLKAEANTNHKKENQSNTNNFQSLRDVKYNQMLYEILTKQYEMARLDEAKDSPIIQVLDQAIEPERKIKPQRTFITVAAFLLGLMTALISLFTNRYIEKLKSEDSEGKIRELKDTLKKI